MKKLLLIAWRDVMAILKAKAFWIGIMMAPIIGVIMAMVMRFAENSQPTRAFVVVDRTGQYQQVIDQYMTKSYTQRALQDYVDYFSEFKDDEQIKVDAQHPEPTQRAKAVLQQHMRGNKNRALDMLLSTGSADGLPIDSSPIDLLPIDSSPIESLVEHSKPLLRNDAPQYNLPKRRYVLVNTPDDLRNNIGGQGWANLVRPYVLGEKKVRDNGRNVGVYAVAIIDGEPITPGIIVDRERHAPRIQYWSSNITNNTLPDMIENLVNQHLQQQLMLASGIDLETLATIEKTKAELSQFDAKKDKGEEGRTVSDLVEVIVPVIFAGILFVVLIIGTSILLQSIIEEKSNRVIEVLLSSVTPNELMAGKLLGVAAVSVVSIAVWLGIAMGLAYFGFGLADASAGGQAVAGGAAAQQNVSPQQVEAVLAAIGAAVSLLPVFIFCFICGYLIYASLFLAIGSLCNSPRDANTLVTPLMLLMMVPMFLLRFIVTDPDGPIVTALTWIPLYTPFAIVARMSAEPPLLEIAGSAVIMVLMTLASLWISARIFRIGVLYSGDTPKFMHLLRFIVSKKQSA